MIADEAPCSSERSAAYQRCPGANSEILRALEQQGARISRDLHDQAAQRITAIKFNLESIRKNISTDPILSKIDQAITDIDKLAENIETVGRGLRYEAIDEYGLVIALEDLVVDWNRRFCIATSIEFSGSIEPIDREAGIALYHVAQEALTNIAKHASTATRVSIILRCNKDQVLLSVEDDGGGFASQVRAGSRGRRGLAGLRERVALVGGAVEIVSRRSSGVAVVARVPSRIKSHECECERSGATVPRR